MIDVNQLSTTVTKSVTDAVKRLDVTKIDVTKIDLTKFDLGTVELPKFELPEFELPEIDVPAGAERIAAFVRDVTYAGIGVSLIAAHKVDAEVRRLVGKPA